MNLQVTRTNKRRRGLASPSAMSVSSNTAASSSLEGTTAALAKFDFSVDDEDDTNASDSAMVRMLDWSCS